MSMDRLTASRAQRSQAYEMSAQNSQTQNGSAMSEFFSEITSIQQGIERINANVAKISALHTRLLNVIDEQLKEQDTIELDNLTNETRSLSNSLKDRIKGLEGSPPGPDAQMKRNRTALLRSKFLEALQSYQLFEKDAQVKSRQRTERQLRIVKPDATPEEVRAVLEGGGQQIFAEAISSTGRYDSSRSAYKEVLERQQNLRKLEQTLANLAQLVVDMGVLVEKQDDTINDIEATAQSVEDDTEKAFVQSIFGSLR
ncbi:t-SNARE [Collybia nuda]|uniref:t-SNARE n=1 Tax=Collybia nuda TaxID=64659 RepID=A0A9P6CN42_9AGAR|nr:t-SNARE [Collybia nuda]